MGIRHKVLRQLAVILFALAVNGVSDVFLLKKQVAGVGDIGENALDGRVLKAAPVDGANALGVQLPRCLQPGLAIEEILVDAPHNSSFLRHDDQPVTLPAVAEDAEVAVRDALLEALPRAPFDIVAD